jgi:hypothetical protein
VQDVLAHRSAARAIRSDGTGAGQQHFERRGRPGP